MSELRKRFFYLFWGAAFAAVKVLRAVEQRTRNEFYRFRQDIHHSVRLGKTTLDRKNISIGRGSHIKPEKIFSGNATVFIGEFCAIGRNDSVKARIHDVSNPVRTAEIGQNQRVEKKIKIGIRVWIGNNVYIRKGIDVGDDVVIGANLVVTRSVPANTVVAAVPAKELTKSKSSASALTKAKQDD